MHLRDDKVKVAFIGAGAMANKVHYPSVASFEDVEIAGICDYSATALHATAEKYGIEQRFTNYREMIDTVKPEAVYVIGPPQLMYDIWMWCLGQGLHVFVEKPLGITLHQAQASAYMAEKHGCITQVGFQRRSSPMVTKLRDECLERGPITHAFCRYYKCQMVPFLEARDRMHDDGVHAIDTVRWMCGGEVVEIECKTQRIGVPDLNYISATLHFDNGATGYLICNWTSGRRIFAVEMHSPGICVEAEHERKGMVFKDGDTKGIEYNAREMAGSEEFFAYGGFLAKHREFIDAIKGGPLPSSHFGDAVKTMEVAAHILAKSTLAR